MAAPVVPSCPPPPTYEEIMGHQTVGSAPTAVQPDELPPLSYIDIMPRLLNSGNMRDKTAPQFDKFSVIVETANNWLRANAMYQVWKCETVERKVSEGPIIELEKMIYHESTFGFNVYIRGLRLWLTKRGATKEPAQQLGLMNIVPAKVVILHPRQMGYGHLGFDAGLVTLGANGGVRGSLIVPTSNITFEGLQQTLDKLNETLNKNPLQGTILNVETMTMKTFEGLGGTPDMDPDQTCWHEEGGKFKRFTDVIRVFYIKGPPANENILVQNFVPEATRKGDMARPTQFQTWPQLMTRVSVWIPQQQGIRIVNIQTQYIKHTDMNGAVHVDADSTDHYVTGTMERKLLKIVRVFYVAHPGPPSPHLGHLSCRTFLPVRKGRKEFESMAETMFRITAWLKATGMPVLSVETHQFLFIESRPAGVEAEKTNITALMMSGKHFLTAITVYFPYAFQEPHPAYLPPKYEFDPTNPQMASESCAIL